VRLIHDIDQATPCVADHERSTRARASAALHNIVMAAAAASRPDDVATRYEVRILRLLEQLRSYCDQLRPANTDIPFFILGKTRHILALLCSPPPINIFSQNLVAT